MFLFFSFENRTYSRTSHSHGDIKHFTAPQHSCAHAPFDFRNVLFYTRSTSGRKSSLATFRCVDFSLLGRRRSPPSTSEYSPTPQLKMTSAQMCTALECVIIQLQLQVCHTCSRNRRFFSFEVTVQQFFFHIQCGWCHFFFTGKSVGNKDIAQKIKVVLLLKKNWTGRDAIGLIDFDGHF